MSCKDIMKALKKLGYYEVKNGRGDHRKFKNENGKTTVVPYRASRQLASGTINAICKQVGITKSDLIKYI